MYPRKVTLTWDGHYQIVLSVFAKLLESSSLVDCTLATEGRQLKAHKEVLSAFSPFFQTLFTEESMEIPTLIFSGFAFKDLQALIDYMYYGKVQVPEDQVESLIDAARILQIQGLESVYDGMNSESHDEHSVHSSQVNVPHKRRRTGNGEECANLFFVEPEIENPIPRVCQMFQLDGVFVVQPNVNGTGINSPELNIIPNVNGFPASSDVPLFSAKQPETFHNNNINTNNNADPLPESMDILNSGLNDQLLMTGNELEVEPEKEIPVDDIRSSIQCDNGSDAFIDISVDISIGNDPDFIGTEPLLQCASDLLTFPPADFSSFVNGPCNENSITYTSTGVQTNDALLCSSGDSSVSSTDTDVLFSSQLVLKNQPFSQNDIFTEGIKENSGEIDTLENEEQSELQDDNNIQSPGAVFDAVEELLNGSHQSVIGSEAVHISSDSDCRTSSPFPSASSLLPAHSPEKQDGYPACNELFSEPSTTINCTQTQTEERSFKCTHCDYATSRAFNLCMHLRTHTGEKPYKCPLCHYATGNSGTLQRHLRVHSGVKPYRCLECGYATSISGNMTVHRRKHTSEKPFNCPECDFVTGYSNALLRHIRLHSRKRPPKCM